MRTRIWLGSLLFLVLVSGCQKSGPTPAIPSASAAQSASEVTAAQEQTPPELADIADSDEMPPPDEGRDSKYSPEREAALAAKLDKNPRDVQSMLDIAIVTQLKAVMTETGTPDYEYFKKSAGYLHRALEVDPKLAESEEFQPLAAEYFYNEARALSQEKQVAESLKSLKEAVDFGWNDLTDMTTNADLKDARENEGFAPILKVAVAKRKAIIKELVGALFEEKNDFTFDFDLKDTAGEPLTKKEFAGKLLMVNVWGTWCKPCQKELPDLAAAYKKYQSQGFEVVGLNTEHETGDEANALIKEAQKKFGINYRCALMDDQTFEQIPDYGTVPTTMFFDRQGKIRLKLVGMADAELLEMIIERLLKDYPAGAPVTTSSTENQ